MFIDSILEDVARRIDGTLWLCDGLTPTQTLELTEIVDGALSNTRRKFQDATIEANDK